MTFFEYMMVMVSLIMALALSHVMRASSDILTSPKRYWVQIVWAVIFVIWVLQGWWALWDQRTVADWTLVKYASMFAFPLILFVIGGILVPSDKIENIDWKSHFYEKRKWFFTSMIVLALEAILTPVLLFGAPLIHPFRVVQLLLTSILIVGLVWKSRKTQGAVVISYLVVQLVGNYLGRMQLGALATN